MAGAGVTLYCDIIMIVLIGSILGFGTICFIPALRPIRDALQKREDAIERENIQREIGELQNRLRGLQ